MNRRKFLIDASVSLTLAAFSRTLLAAGKPLAQARLTVQTNHVQNAIASDFLGFSYESAQLATPDFFSPMNVDFAGFFKQLGPNGVLRIGGNTSGSSFWSPEAASSTSTNKAEVTSVGPDEGKLPLVTSHKTPQAIRNLREFLDMTQWRCIFGLNLVSGTPEQAAEEAAAVSEILGDRLICFQFGNEVDNYAKKGLRPADYDFAAYTKEWTSFYNAVSARLPHLKVAGPDSAITGAWVSDFAKQFADKVMLLTTHYYAEGPPTSPASTIENLFSATNPRWDDEIPNIRQAMAESNLPYRLTETNSCFHGGKPGVSNSFASSLWALDLIFQVALLGGSGINFHSGGYGWYSPIVGNVENGFVARPEYYALLLFSQILGGQLIQNRLDISGVSTDESHSLVCHTLKSPAGKLQAVIINKNPAMNFNLTMQANVSSGRIAIQRLIAPTLESLSDVTFSGAPVGMSGSWRADKVEHSKLESGVASCLIPAASAALLTWEA